MGDQHKAQDKNIKNKQFAPVLEYKDQSAQMVNFYRSTKKVGPTMHCQLPACC